MKEKNDWIKKDGGWYHNQVFYPKVAKIKADRLLKSPEFRGLFHPNTMVYYCDNLIHREEVEPGQYIYLASVRNVEGEDAVCRPIPLGLLEFTPEQKKELKRATGFPSSAFEKLHSGIQDMIDEPFGVGLGDDYPEMESMGQ